MQFIPPQVFDVLILVISAVGIVIAIRRIQSDFRKGPRFPQDGTAAAPAAPQNADKLPAAKNTLRKRK
jgi:ABC-type Co2+ transport system permease subunit